MRKIDIDGLLALDIPNLRPITVSSEIIGIRGMTLSSTRNRKHLKAVKAAGIDAIIDLRSADYSNHNVNFVHACEASGLDYCHFPMDKSHTADAQIIENLPLLIDSINRGGFYIACAQGLHRTDIALSLHYLFNPKTQEPPMLFGHIKNGTLRVDDIFTRANSVFRNLKTEDKNRLGWDESFEMTFVSRKKQLTAWQYNTNSKL